MESFPIAFQYWRMVGKQLKRLDQQIIEIQRIRRFQTVFVGHKHIMQRLTAEIAVCLHKPFIRAHQLVLCVGNLRLDLPRRQKLFVDILMLQNVFND